jgi:zinc transport system substrate-binding protein
MAKAFLLKKNSGKTSCGHFIRCLCCLIFYLLIVSSCVRHVQPDCLLIAVSILPQEWFVNQIAGEKAQVIILAGPGQNPHNYEPSPRQIQSLMHASAWILSGTEFEISLLPKISALFPNLLIVDGTQGVQFRLPEDHVHHDCDGACGGHGYDRHTWLGREPAGILAAHVRDTLSLLDNENEEYYHERYKNLIRNIDDVFDELHIILYPLKGTSIFVYHPSFGYFFDEFGIHQVAVETGGKEPTPRQLNNLIEKMNIERPAAVFVQVQFPVNAARTLANTVGAQVLELDPLAQDWLENIRHMGQMLQGIIP